jgi:hypothetical protein
MPALVAGIPVLKCCSKDVDGRDKSGHDELSQNASGFSGRCRVAEREGFEPIALA